MRWGLACAMTCAVSTAGCARLNPAFGDDEATSGAAGATGGAGTTTGAGPGTTSRGEGEGEASESDAGPGVDVGVQGVCGDGKLDPDEICDDGNLDNDDACLDDCTQRPVVEWVYETEVEPPIRRRFNALDVAGGIVVAGGRGGAGTSETLSLHSVGLDGAHVDAVDVTYGTGIGAEVRSVAFRGDAQLYFAGRSTNVDTVSVLGLASLDADGSIAVEMTVPLAGTRAQGLGVGEDGLVVGIGIDNMGGLGLAGCAFDLACDGAPSPMAGTQLDDLMLGTPILAAGFIAEYPVIVEAASPMTQSIGTFVSGEIPGRFQALAVDEGRLFAAGTRQRSLGDSDDVAWLAAFERSSGDLLWDDEVSSDSLEDDEFEDVAVTPEGNVVVVGMRGVPARPVVREYDGDGGVRWTLDLMPPGDFEVGFARAVVVRDEGIYVAGEWGPGPLGEVATGTAGFVVKFSR